MEAAARRLEKSGSFGMIWMDPESRAVRPVTSPCPRLFGLARGLKIACTQAGLGGSRRARLFRPRHPSTDGEVMVGDGGAAGGSPQSRQGECLGLGVPKMARA